jgi:hypothetical protein
MQLIVTQRIKKHNYTIKYSQTQHDCVFCITTLQRYYIYICIIALRHVSARLNHR